MIELACSAAPLVSVIIPASATAAMLDACLASIARHGPTEVAYETIVVLNEADTSAEAELLVRTSGVRVISSPVNLGLAGAGNRGRSVARGAYLLLLHDDAEVHPGWMEALVAAAEAHPEAGAFGSKVMYFDGRLQNAGMVLWSDATTTAPWIGDPPPAEEFDAGRAVDYCGTSSLLVRASSWDEIGGLDERFYPVYFVDVDLAMSLRAHGRAVRYVPGSRIAHHQGGARSPWFRSFAAARNQALLRDKWSVELADHEPGIERADDASEDDLVSQLARALRRAERTAERLQSSARARHPSLRARVIDALEHDEHHRQRAVELQRAFSTYLLEQLAQAQGRQLALADAVQRAEGERDHVRSTARYPLGLELRFGLDGAASLFPVSGCHPAETWGAWMGSTPCSLLLQPLWPNHDAPLALELGVELVHFVAGTRSSSTVRVLVNGQLVLDECGSSGGQAAYVSPIPERAYERGGVLALSIEVDGAASPRDLGVNDDERPLSVGLVALVVRAADTT